jgi:sulfide:quinone oxidoreductase
MTNFRVVISGGGVAAVEAMLRVRRLGGEHIDLTVVAPNEDFVYRPLAVREPFAGPGRTRHPLADVARACQATLVHDRLGWYELGEQAVHTEGGQTIPYDASLVAVGAYQQPATEHVATITDANFDEHFTGIVRDIEEGYSKSLAMILPEGPVWPLPLYELALMTAERAESMGIDDFALSFITAEVAPLAIFGRAASDRVRELMVERGITLYTTASAHAPEARHLILQPSGEELRPERMVGLPTLSGPVIRGLPGAGLHGFVPIDKHCMVPNSGGRVFAAGDATSYPIKHGGLGAQQADIAAAAIARLAGAPVEIPPFLPVIRGTLFTGGTPIYMTAKPVGAHGFDSELYDKPPWREDEKIVAAELGDYLTQSTV